MNEAVRTLKYWFCMAVGHKISDSDRNDFFMLQKMTMKAYCIRCESPLVLQKTVKIYEEYY